MASKRNNTQLVGRYWPTDKAYRALGITPPNAPWWRRLLRGGGSFRGTVR